MFISNFQLETNMVYLVLDLDNTVWEKQELDNKSYESVSQRIFGRRISLLTNPITGERDRDFAKCTNHDIWRYKLQQVLDSGECLVLGSTPIARTEEIDIGELVTKLGIAAVDYVVRAARIDEVVKSYLIPNDLLALSRAVSHIGVASSGARVLQDKLLRDLGFYGAGLERGLCSFAEEGRDKRSLVANSVQRYKNIYRNRPQTVVYVGDSEEDMAATKALAPSASFTTDFRAVGVLTGMTDEHELIAAGAHLVIPSLQGPQNLKKLFVFLQGLNHEG